MLNKRFESIQINVSVLLPFNKSANLLLSLFSETSLEKKKKNHVAIYTTFHLPSVTYLLFIKEIV